MNELFDRERRECMFAKLLICIFILSHVLTSFYFQRGKLEHGSKTWIRSGPLYFFIFSSIFTIVFIQAKLLFVILIVSIVRYFIDKGIHYIKTKEGNHLKALLVFIGEQLLHILIILLLYPVFKTIVQNSFMNGLLERIISTYPYLEGINNIDTLSFMLLVTAGILFTINGGTILSLMMINLLLEKVKLHKKERGVSQRISHEEIAVTIEQSSFSKGRVLEVNLDVIEEEKKRYGKIIGIIERLIIVMAILVNKFELIAIVTAVKSIARFKEITNKTSDYYIIGTFASFSIAFLIGFLLLFLKKVVL
ncbi:DUF3307 domain-containing protein [Bacillus sp. BGMRC 2118]|nr:DUF3307 domain-containing protein [Bacillus sp. BGMRC 2118]